MVTISEPNPLHSHRQQEPDSQQQEPRLKLPHNRLFEEDAAKYDAAMITKDEEAARTDIQHEGSQGEDLQTEYFQG